MKLKKVVGLTAALAVCLTLIAFVVSDVNASEESSDHKGMMPEAGSTLVTTEEKLELDEAEAKGDDQSPQFISLEADSSAMANVADETDVYSAASYDSEIVGRIYTNTKVSVEMHTDEWASITSGELSGYVPCSALMFGSEGDVLMDAKCDKCVTVESNTNLRESADQDSVVIGTLVPGVQYPIEEEHDDYYYVTDGTISGYVYADCVQVSHLLRDGNTNEEIAELEMIEETLESAIPAYATLGGSARDYSDQYADIQLSDEERELPLKVAYLEAGDNYSEAVKVINTVYNRYLDGEWGESIEDILTREGQYAVLDDAQAEDATYSENIEDALNDVNDGLNTVGDAESFRATGDGITNYYF